MTPTTVPNRQQIRALPKVELHVHLEGTLSAERIAVVADALGEPLPRRTEELFDFEDLSAFLAFLDWTCGLIRTPEIAADTAYDFARRATRNGTVYAEVIINPAHWRGWNLGELVESLTVGFERAQADGLAECHLLLSILRSQSGEEATALVEWMGRHRPRRVVGLSIDGDEARSGRTSPRFAAAYALAGELGFGRTAHAGESSGADGVRDAIDLLGVDRIDHGVRVVEDASLVTRIVEAGITLNVCISSNLVHLYPNRDSHPFSTLYAAGVPMTINTDDPGYLGVDLDDEFATVAGMMGWGMVELAQVTRLAINAAFCPPATKASLHAGVDSFLASWEQEPTR